MNQKILHVAVCDKFIPPFLAFLERHFDTTKHDFWLLRGLGNNQLNKKQSQYLPKPGVLSRLIHYARLIEKIRKSEKVILHGLFDPGLILILFLMPRSLKKCYWLIWGGDLYEYQSPNKNWRWRIKEFQRRSIISNMGYLVTSIDGDYENAAGWYNAKGRRLDIYAYPSALHIEPTTPSKETGVTRILLGNSANPSNHHTEIIELLEPFKNQNLEIYAPLSYGSRENAAIVTKFGQQVFGHQFKPLTDMMEYKEYIDLLSSVHIAIFNHNRQQAMSTARVLLGMGKKVYMRRGTSSFRHFEKLGVKLFELESFDLEPSFPEALQNTRTIRSIYSEKTLFSNLALLFGQ